MLPPRPAHELSRAKERGFWGRERRSGGLISVPSGFEVRFLAGLGVEMIVDGRQLVELGRVLGEGLKDVSRGLVQRFHAGAGDVSLCK